MTTCPADVPPWLGVHVSVVVCASGVRAAFHTLREWHDHTGRRCYTAVAVRGCDAAVPSKTSEHKCACAASVLQTRHPASHTPRASSTIMLRAQHDDCSHAATPSPAPAQARPLATHRQLLLCPCMLAGCSPAPRQLLPPHAAAAVAKPAARQLLHDARRRCAIAAPTRAPRAATASSAHALHLHAELLGVALLLARLSDALQRRLEAEGALDPCAKAHCAMQHTAMQRSAHGRARGMANARQAGGRAA